MKKPFLISALCMMLASFSACGKADVTESMSVETGTETVQNAVEKATVETGTDAEKAAESTAAETEKPAESIEEEPENIPEASEAASGEIPSGPEAAADSYEGEYNDYDVNDPSLEIQKNEDGTYTIQIEIYRLAYMDNGVGNITDNGLEFSATAPNGNAISGSIALDGEVATVTFASAEWSEYSDVNEYRYYKTSDIPNVYVP